MRHHFSFRLALILVVFTSLVMSLFVIARLYYANQGFHSDLEERSQRISERIASAVNPSIWEIYRKSHDRSYSEEFASSILDSELTDPYVMGIIVYGRFGQLYMGKFRLDPNTIIAYRAESYDYLADRADLVRSYPIKNGLLTIGKVEVFFDTTLHRKQLRDALILEMVQIGFISLLFVLVLYFILRKALLKPMESLEIARQTFESMGEAIVYVDLEGRIFDVNPAFTRLTGFESYDVIGRPCHSILPAAESGEDLCQIHRGMGEQLNWSGEISCRRSNQEDFPVWLTVTSVRNEEGEGVCLVYLFQDISSQKQAESQLKKLAYYDTLTGLPNRRYFEEQLHTELKTARRMENIFSILFIDLDEFKYVNDSVGHSAGDALLVEVSRRFSQRIRESDTLARLGGDEFTVIVPHQSGEGADEGLTRLAQDLIDLARQPVRIANREFTVGASIGIAEYPRDGETISELIKHADSAMYQAKEFGRNCYSFFSPELNRKVQQRLELKTAIQQAIKNAEFVLHFQPKIDLKTREILGAEALVRWQTPAGKLVYPDQFIPLAEESSLILGIGNWVIQEAIKQLKLWQQQGRDDLTLAINLSAKQLHDADLFTTLQNAIIGSGIDAGKLELEITESAVIADLGSSIDTLFRLKGLGLKIAMDDFGTGYSSLSYLKRLPVDILKIDRSFIADLHIDPDDASIVTTILLLAQSLGIDVVAEGIENEQQLAFLLERGCDVGQGYYFAPPQSVQEFEKSWKVRKLHMISSKENMN